MKLLQWEAIRSFQKLGILRFDFVGARINPEKGSKQEAINSFKRRLGGKLIQGYMWKYALRPVKSIAYTLAIRFLKGGDIVDHERHKLKNYDDNAFSIYRIE
jgi:lipid II:glycine glycyltransferase (peptidoglycan interpeptide bridge formation enzyme)